MKTAPLDHDAVGDVSTKAVGKRREVLLRATPIEIRWDADRVADRRAFRDAYGRRVLSLEKPRRHHERDDGAQGEARCDHGESVRSSRRQLRTGRSSAW